MYELKPVHLIIVNMCLMVDPQTPARASLLILNILKASSHTFFSSISASPTTSPSKLCYESNPNSPELTCICREVEDLRAKQGLLHSSVLVLHPTALTPATKALKWATKALARIIVLIPPAFFSFLIFPLLNKKITLYFHHPLTWSLFRQDQNR